MYEKKGGQAHPSLEYIFCISGFDMFLDFRHGWIWLDTHKIQSNPCVCPCIQTNTTLHMFLDQEKKKVRKCMKGGGTGSPLLRIHFENMWSWLDLVGYAKFRSFALVVCHRLQQRKLIPAKMKNKTKNKNTIKTQNRQKQPARFTI